MRPVNWMDSPSSSSTSGSSERERIFVALPRRFRRSEPRFEMRRTQWLVQFVPQCVVLAMLGVVAAGPFLQYATIDLAHRRIEFAAAVHRCDDLARDLVELLYKCFFIQRRRRDRAAFLAQSAVNGREGFVK